MASSPGSNLDHQQHFNNPLKQQQQLQQQTSTKGHSHLTNGYANGMQHQHIDNDAIVPASDPEDDSTDEDDEYNSYIQDQEQQYQQHHQIHYDSADGEEDHGGDEDDSDVYSAQQYHQQQNQLQNQQQQQPHHHQHQQLQQIQQQYQLQQQQQRNAYQSQHALQMDHNLDQDMSVADSREEEEYYQQNPQHNPHLQHQGDIDMHQQDDFDDDEFDDEDEDDEDDQGDDSLIDEDEASETISLREEDIDFNLVYAFHTFVATQEGQASVVRNDALMLLEDTNVYWWLVRVINTNVIGYIPAENIETPFERLARLNTHRNAALTARSPEWGTFDEHPGPLSQAVLAQRAMNRRSVIFTAQNDFLEASETEWTDEEEEDADWYDDGEDGEEEDDDEHDDDDEDDDTDHHDDDHDDLQDEDEEEYESHDGDSSQHSQLGDGPQNPSIQQEAERVHQEILNEQRRIKSIATGNAMDVDQDTSRYSQQSSKSGGEREDEDEEDEDLQVTNRYRRPLLDEDDLLLSNSEPRVISLTPPIARDDAIGKRAQPSPNKMKNVRMADELLEQRVQSPSRQQASQQQQSSAQTQQQQQQPHSAISGVTRLSINSVTGVRSPSLDSEEEDRERMRRKMAERKDAKLDSLLGKNPGPLIRKTKEEYEEGLPPPAVVVKKPGKFKSLFGVGKSSKDKERKEKERQEKERLKNIAKGSSTSGGSGGIGSSLFRARSNSNGSIGSSSPGPSSSASPTTPSRTSIDKSEPPQQEFMTLRVYPGNVDFGASMYKTVVVTPATMASDVAHQAVIKFRLAPDGTASTGDFYLTVKGVDGDESVLQASDKPMAIYQSLTAHLTTPLPPNHRLSISSVSSMMSIASTGSQTSGAPQSPTTPTGPRRSSSNRSDSQPRSIRFMLNKKIRKSNSITSNHPVPAPATVAPASAPQDDTFWVKVVCQAQDLPQSMLLLDGMGTAMDKSDPRTVGQSLATKVEHWIPMYATSNAGDVIFSALEKVGIRSGVVDGVPEHVMVAKRATVPNGLVIAYRLGFKVNNSASKKSKQGEETPLEPQNPLVRCFEEHQVVPIRRSPKADVASMPLHPDHVFFLRKSPKSLQAEMRYMQEQLQAQQSQAPARKVPSPLRPQLSRSGESSDGTSSAQASPTFSITGMLSPSSPGPQTRNFNAANAALMNASRLGGTSGAGSPLIRIPRRTDSVIMSPTSPPVRTNSIDNSSGRPSPALSVQSVLATQQIHPPQVSRTPTPDRHQAQQQQQQQQQPPQQQQAPARSPSSNQGSPTQVARPLQAPSPAPSNISSHPDQQEGSRSSTPERQYRPDRQRATSPSLTHGPSPLSLSAVMAQGEQMSPSGTHKGSAASIDELLSPIAQSSRLIMKRNATQGVDIVLNKGTIRSVKTTSALTLAPQFQYSFVPLEGGEEIDISEIIEDVLGGDCEDEQDGGRQSPLRNGEGQQELETMSRRERLAAAVARASQAVAAGKERRKASTASESILSPASPDTFIKRQKSTASPDRDMLEQLGTSTRGAETLLKLERALAGGSTNSSTGTDANNGVDVRDESSSSTSAYPGSAESKPVGLGSRNLPSPMSLNSSSSPSSPTLVRKSSDGEVQVVSVAKVVPVNGRNQSPLPSTAGMVGGNARSASPGMAPSSPGGPHSPSSPGFARATLLSSVSAASAPGSHRVVHSNPSSPLLASFTASSPHQQHPLEGRSFSPLPRPLQTPSPASSTRPNPHQLSIQTGATEAGSSSVTTLGGPASAGPVLMDSTLHSSSASARTQPELQVRRSNSRSRSASTSAASGLESVSMAPTTPATAQQHDPWLLASDYNTGMQDLLTLVRGGRASSLSTSAPSSTRSPSGLLTYGKDGRIMHPPSSAPSMNKQQQPGRQRLMSLQPQNAHTATALSSLYNTTSSKTTFKDTHSHEQQQQQQQQQRLDDNYAMNDSHTTTTNDKLFSNKQMDYYPEQQQIDDNEPRIWSRTDRRLRDVRHDCHPEVFECWREVDADLDKVERELNSLLATVKATIF
ncbi:hypothetical protein BGZ98_005898 [Dissophora globulifera]|nr:hypothetical protein BGZ98_005898 [Dissophora globulifera]